MVDMVNHPPHYQIKLGEFVNVEALDIIKASLSEKEFIGYLKGNTIKYSLRSKNKGGNEDWKKIIFYMQRLSTCLP